MIADGRKSRLDIDGLLVLTCLTFLLILGVVAGTPFFEGLRSSRLTYVTALTLPLFVVFALIARRFDRVADVLKDWWQVFGVLLVYENLKHMHANRITEWLGILPKDNAMRLADEWLFGRTLPLYFDTPFFSGFFSHIMWFFYIWVYYLGPVLLLGYAYFVLEDQNLFRRLRRALIVGLLGGYALYILVPVAGPLFLMGEQFTTPILTQPILQKLAFSTLRYQWDCFPSLHTAIPWLLTLVAWRQLPRLGQVFAIVGASGVTLSTIALRFHYGIDIIAGVIWAVLVSLAVQRIPSVSHGRGSITPSRITLLGRLFVLTGCAGLLAEQAFEKLLGTLLGASTPAAAIVLAVYFLGLTVGGTIYGPVIRPRVGNPLRTFACLEAGVAIWSLALYLGYERLIPFFTPFLSLGRDSFILLECLRFVVAAIWILPPTILMGATFPAIVDALDSMQVSEPRSAAAKFYSLNLLGALVGALLGPYLTFPYWGVDGTLLFTYVVDALVAIVAFQFARDLSIQLSHTDSGTVGIGRAGASKKKISVLLAVALVSGFLFFSLEVVWTHLIATVLGNSIYAFSAMLAPVLAGLGLGGMIVTRILPRDQPIPGWGLSLAFLAAAGLLAWQYGQWQEIPHRFTIWGGNLGTFAQGEVLRWIQAALLLLPTAAILGVVYPCLFRLDLFPIHERGMLAGRLAAVNAVGCILGALLTGFLLIPTLGSATTLKLLAIGAVSCAFAVGVPFLGRLGKLVLGGASLVMAVYVVFQPPWNRLSLTTGEHVYFAPNQVWPGTTLRFFHEDTLGGMTTVVHNPAGTRGQKKPYLTLLTNGKFQGNDAWEMAAQTGFALVPILHTIGRDSAMVIGLGTGRSAAVVDAFGFRRIDIAEISPGVVQAAREEFAHINGRILEKPHVRLFLEDGRNKLLLHTETYDLITMEISSVWFAGSTNLYSREFYRLARERLNPDGIFQQWIQLHHIGQIEVASVIATLRSVFPYVSFWHVGGQGILVASEQPQVMRRAAIDMFLSAANSLDIPAGREHDFLKKVALSRLLSPEDVTNFVKHIAPPLNTDANRYLEYATPRYNLSRIDHPAQNRAMLAQYGGRRP